MCTETEPLHYAVTKDMLVRLVHALPGIVCFATPVEPVSVLNRPDRQSPDPRSSRFDLAEARLALPFWQRRLGFRLRRRLAGLAEPRRHPGR